MKAHLAIVVAWVGGCTSVHVAQRNDCWIRTTDAWPGQITEEVGPCTRAAPAWVPDRLTRLVQECVAQADYRWQNKALAAWGRGEPLPPRDGEDNALQACTAEATKSVIAENEALQARLSAIGEERERLRAHDDQITEALGEAAKKPAGSAVATASAEGRGDGQSNSRQDSKSETSHATDLTAAAPAAPVVFQAPASAPQAMPIILQAPAPQAMPIILQAPAPQAMPIVLQAPAPSVVRVGTAPSAPRSAPKKPACPPSPAQTAEASSPAAPRPGSACPEGTPAAP